MPVYGFTYVNITWLRPSLLASMDYFRDKVAIVTGGASGLGMALSEELGKRGATVVPVDVNQEGAQKVAAGITSTGGKATYAHLDVTLYENAEKVIKDITDKYGRLDLMFNNAGTTVQGESRDLAVHHWHKVIAVNLLGVIYCTIAAYPIMVKQGDGQIVNISSLAGLIPLPNEVPYCTSKWGIAGFTNSLRLEGADLGIKINLVCPGLMHTPLHDSNHWVNINQDKLNQPVPKKFFMTPAKAAQEILKGVERNKAINIFPFYARFISRLYRFSPSIFQLISRRTMRDFRKIRIVH